MAVRNESVRLSLVDDFSTGMARAAAATALLNRELNSLSGQSVKTARVSQNINRDTDALAKSANKADSSINQLTGRLRLFADLAAIFGSTIAPIGALAVPAISGLANQLGVAALAGGTAILAFQGVGDTLKAVNEASIEPTSENLEKARQAMLDLSPAARDMVLRLQELRPVMQGLRDTAAAGLFPGVLEAFDSLESRVPEVERILSSVSATLGEVVASGAEGLASNRWDDFFAFLAREVPETLVSLGRTVGDLTHGMAELWMAFDPLNDDFSSWLEDVAAGFDSWASGLAQTEGFNEFIDYVRTNGPQVADTFTALADAVLQIVEASAPLGGPVLQALESVAKVIATIADSDLGTPIMAGVAAMALLSRATSTYGALAATSFGSKAKANLAGMVGALGTVTSAQDRATQSATMLARAETQRAEAVRRGLSTVGKAAAGVGALAVATTGIADNVGLSNTAMLGLVGTIAGPYGAALGAATGFAMDAAQANNDLGDALERVGSIARDAPLDFSGQASALDEARRQIDDFAKAVDTDNFANMLNPGAWKNLFEDVFGDSDLEEAEAKFAALSEEIVRNQQTWAYLGDTMTNFQGPSTQITDIERLTEIAEGATPALAAMGLTIDDLSKMDPPELASVARDIEEFNRAADSTPGRTAAVGDAIASLDDDLLSTADSAQSLASALETLLGPALGAEAATDAFREGLRGMRDEMEGTRRTFAGFNEAAIINRQVTRDRANEIVAMLSAEAKAGASAKELARSLNQSRTALIEEGIALGFSRKQMVDRARAMGLTPKLVRTVFEAAGIDKEKQEIRNLKADIDKLPKQVQTALKTANYQLTKGQINDLQREYDLTPKEVRTLLAANDKASDLINGVRGNLQSLDGDVAEVTIRTVRETINKVVNDVAGLVGYGRRKASGGYISGPGGPRDDLIPARLSNGEYVIQAAAVARYGRAMFDRLNAMQFANGGYVGRQITNQSSSSTVYGSTFAPVFRIDSITTTDAQALARALERRQRDAYAVARLP